ncbi:MAG TPA: NADH-quinone oxidoreductase subunit M [Alphaproteobacteria bacterium]|nr:NADH-quinone oxidoreductase subunit M [Alphaproteobacteria bacterium]
MAFNEILLPIITFLPLVGVVVILWARGKEEIVARHVRWVALWTSLATLALAIFLWINFDPTKSGYQFVVNKDWLPGLPVRFFMGVDGLSILFIILSAFLVPVCIVASWYSVQQRVKEYMIAFLVLETFMIGAFCALDLVLFYVFFEGVLIPMYLIIGIWGGKGRIYASFKFFLYTLLGSVLMLIAILAIIIKTNSSDISYLSAQELLSSEWQFWLWLAFFASFAVKVPMWPVHTWLPDAHVEAPTSGSVILAGVLLKMGGYGFIRVILPIMPDASQFFAPLIFALSIIAVIYTSLVALAQRDIKKLIAYSSIAHMGFVTAGIFSLTHQGIEGAVLQMLSHGVVSGALFLCVGVLYDRLHTREIDRFGGLAIRMPIYAMLFLLFTMASIALPGTSGFVAEFLILLGIFEANYLVAIAIGLGMVLGAVYMLILYRRIMLGRLEKQDLMIMPDIRWHEAISLLVLAAVVLWMGIYPSSFLNITTPMIKGLVAGFSVTP